MTYDDAVRYLDTFVNFEHARSAEALRAIPLARMRRLCQRLGDPQRRFRSVLVAGTNGKGSIAAMLYAMLRESTLRVGLYTSPHLEHLRERIRVSADPDAGRAHGEDWIGPEAFAAHVAAIQPLVEELRPAPEGPPTCFELLTAVALRHFASQRVEVAVLEVGLGGRLDATNVVEPAASIFAPIDVDHAEILGRDRTLIAREKAGIIKPNQVVIAAPQPDEVLAVLREAADQHAAPCLVAGRDFTAAVEEHTLEGLRVSLGGLRGAYEHVRVPLPGRHQAWNAAAAVVALEVLSNAGQPHELVARGLASTVSPGRLEVVHETPLVLLDGAHNPHALVALRDTLTELCPGRRAHLLVGMSSDKSVEALGQLLGGLVGSATCTRSHHPRALEPLELARRLAPYCADVSVMSDPVDAYTYVVNAAAPSDVVVVAGSLFLVGQLRAALRHSQLRIQRERTSQAAAKAVSEDATREG